MRFRSFIQDRGEVVRFESVREPTGHFSSVIDVFEQALDQERAVTQYINYLYALAQDEKDFATQSFHNWFVDEQVDEEKSVMGIIDWIRTLGDSRKASIYWTGSLAARSSRQHSRCGSSADDTCLKGSI